MNAESNTIDETLASREPLLLAVQGQLTRSIFLQPAGPSDFDLGSRLQLTEFVQTFAHGIRELTSPLSD